MAFLVFRKNSKLSIYDESIYERRDSVPIPVRAQKEPSFTRVSMESIRLDFLTNLDGRLLGKLKRAPFEAVFPRQRDSNTLFGKIGYYLFPSFGPFHASPVCPTTFLLLARSKPFPLPTRPYRSLFPRATNASAPNPFILKNTTFRSTPKIRQVTFGSNPYPVGRRTHMAVFL